MEKTDEEVGQYFSKLIRDMSDDEFWEWVRSWKDTKAVCEEVEGWNIERKRKEISYIKIIMENNRHLANGLRRMAEDLEKRKLVG